MINPINLWHKLSISTKCLLILALPLITLLIAIYHLYTDALAIESAEQSLIFETSHLIKIQSANAQLTNASAGIRGYLLTGNEAFLESYYQAKIKLPKQLSILQLAFKDTILKNHLNQLQNFITDILNSMDYLIHQQSVLSKEEVSASLLKHRTIIHDIRQHIELMNVRQLTIIHEKETFLGQLRKEDRRLTMYLAFIFVFTALLSIRLYFLNMVKRINILCEQAALLANGESLASNITPSQDEIAHVTKSLVNSSKLLALRQMQTESARREAEVANAAKTQFLTRTSHDLRTPLNVIIGYAQILRDDLPAGKLQSKASLILATSNHLLMSINDLLNISKIETGNAPIKSAHYLLKPIVDESQALLAQAAQEKNIKWIVHIESDAEVFVDRQKLIQILINLISNAIKYGPSNAPLTIWCESTRTHQLLYVKDEGEGVPAHLRHRLFTDYDRLGAEQSEIPGLGLGLSSAQALATAMNSKISLADVGSIFCIHLPIIQKQAHHTKSVESLESDLINPNPFKELLFVNDIPDNTILIETLIRRNKHIVLHTTSTTQNLIEWLDHNRVDMILIDFDCANCDGEKLLQSIRLKLGYQEIPIIILTDHLSIERITYLDNIGATLSLTKPIDTHKLKQTIQANLS